MDRSSVERTLDSTTAYRGRILTLRVDEVELASGGTSVREVVEHPGGVAVVAVDGEGRAVIVRQYRYPVREALWEIPAGKLDPGEEPRECALRELEEETGYRAGRLEGVVRFYTSPGFSDEALHLFFAGDLSPGERAPDDDEIIECKLVSRGELDDMIRKGEIRDGKTLLGISLAISKGIL